MSYDKHSEDITALSGYVLWNDLGKDQRPLIYGIPGNRIENITLENINIQYPGRATKGMAYIPLWRIQDVPEQINKYPEFTMFGELPAWGFYLRHVDGIRFKDVHLSLADEDFRPPFVFDDVRHLDMSSLTPDV